MFETAELGNKIDKAAFKAAAEKLRVELRPHSPGSELLELSIFANDDLKDAAMKNKLK